MAGRVTNNNNGVSQFDSVARDKHTIKNPMSKHPATLAILAMHAMAANQTALLPPVKSYMMGFYGQPMIVGNGKSRKKKSNRLHRSRMLRRMHRRNK